MTTQRRYTGTLKAVILDWSGTTVDYGCMAPARVFGEVFEQQGVSVSDDEARAPMGRFKRDHIREMTEMPRIAACWQQVHGRAPTEADIDAMYDAYTPLQMDLIAQYADLIPGVLETVRAFRERGLKIGSSTGFTREMMGPLLPEAARQGYEPDALFCPDDVGAGRPEPWMCFANLHRLGVYPAEAAVKLGDTVADVREGHNAGLWTIALAKTGNEVGLSEAAWDALGAHEQARKLAVAYERLEGAGAHYVVDSLADALPVLDAIEARLREGEKP